MIFGKKVLAISPHTDDAELGAGGTLARLVESGHEIYVVALSQGTLADGTLASEFRQAMKTLRADHWIAWQFPVRRFYTQSDAVLDFLIGFRDSFNPDTVLVPAQADDHQDHQVVTAEALRAFKHCTLLGYELPWNHVGRPFDPRCYVKLCEKHVELKQAALACYLSQMNKPYMNSWRIEAVMRMRGLQINSPFAEAFEVMRWIA